MEPELNDEYQTIPIVFRVDRFNVPETVLIGIWQYLFDTEKYKMLFYDGSIYDLQTFLTFLKTPGCIFFIVVNKGEIRHFAWLDMRFPPYPSGHHCSLGNLRVKAIRSILRYWRDMKHPGTDKPIFDIILGLTPKTYEKALKFLKIGKFVVVGNIPRCCNLYYNKIKDDGVLSYIEIQKVE